MTVQNDDSIMAEKLLENDSSICTIDVFDTT